MSLPYDTLQNWVAEKLLNYVYNHLSNQEKKWFRITLTFDIMTSGSLKYSFTWYCLSMNISSSLKWWATLHLWPYDLTSSSASCPLLWTPGGSWRGRDRPPQRRWNFLSWPGRSDCWGQPTPGIGHWCCSPGEDRNKNGFCFLFCFVFCFVFWIIITASK